MREAQAAETSRQQRPEHAAPRRIAAWTLEQKLAVGGGGAVWAACHDDDEAARHVVKLVPASEPAAISRLRAEARLLLEIPCPALPDVIAWLPPGHDGFAGLVLERRYGETLDQALPGAGPTTLARAGEAALLALMAVHASGTVHGDLHPGNLLLDAFGGVALLDLGLAARIGSRAEGPGLPAYASPERLRDEAVDPRDDLFSLAMTLWRGLGLPCPFPDYPAILPVDRDRAEVPAGHAASSMLRVLAGWLHPRRALRPGHAEAALREWRAAAGPLLADGPSPLPGLAGRSWICAGVPGDEQTSLVGDVVLIGPSGSGRTGALRGVAQEQRGPVVWLRGRFGATALDRAEAEAERVGTVAARQEDAASRLQDQTVEGGLGGAAAAAQARIDGRLRAIARGLGSDGALLVDDLDLLPAAVAEAVAMLADSPVEGRARIVVSSRTAVELTGPRTLQVQPMRAAEVAAAVQAADGGRAWDDALLAAMAAAVGVRRDRVWPLVGALLADGTLLRSPDRVELVALEPEAAVQQALAHALQPPAPPEALHALLAHLLVDPLGVRGGADDPAPAPDEADLGSWPWLRRRRGGGFALDAGAVAVARSAVERAQQAAAALARADRIAAQHPHRATELRLRAAQLGAQVAIEPSAVGGAAEDARAAGDAAGALALLRMAAEVSGSAGLPAAVATIGVQAATALGRFDDALALAAVAAEPPAAGSGQRAKRGAAAGRMDAVELRLAVCEANFRRGSFAEARGEADAALQLLGVREDKLGDWPRQAALALVLRAFAATWQGDLDAARVDLDRGRTVTSPWPELRAQIDYLDALGRYYAGEIEAARRAFDHLIGQDVAPAITAAAAAGVGLCAQRYGDLARARMAYDESRRLAERAGDRARVLNMTMNLATIDHEAGDLGLAKDGYDRVVNGALRLGNEGAQVRALVNRGNLQALLGQNDAAVADLEAALPLLASTGNAYLEGNVRCVLAELARESGRLGDAAELIGAGIARLEAVGAASELAELRLESAWLAIARGELQAARRAAEEVEGRAAALQSEELASRALHVRARVAWHEAMAEAATPREAARHLDTALGQLADASGRMPTSKVIGGVRIDTDRAMLLAATGRIGDAQTVARAALERLERVAATLEPDPRRRFVASPSFAAIRDMLTVCVRVGSGEPRSSISSLGGSTEFTIGRAAHHAVMAINQRLSAEYDQERLLETLMDSAITLTGAERGFMLLDGRDSPELDVAVARNLDGENLRKPAHKLSHSLALEVYGSGEPVLATDAQLDPRFAEQESVHTGGLRSILCVPLISRGKTIGVIYVDNRFAAGAFSREHAAILEALASQAAIAIHTARLIGRLRQREVELEQSRSEVVALNARLEAELASTEDALADARRQLLSERGEAARRSDYANIRGASPELHRLFKLIDRVRDHDFPVLVIGESGTGKELVARAIHFTGARKEAPFVAINCGALPENLLESELFGHVRGAFTGAVGDRRGLFEQAHGGTLFLDEIGEMPGSMQVKLLRVLQTGELTRVGGAGSRKVDVRVVAATHRDLDRMVRESTFREDLLYRLRVVDLHVPPLRDRSGDLELLADHFLAANRKAGLGSVRRITKGALRRMRAYNWPGNVRELETFLKSACLFAESDTLDVPDIAPLLERAEGKAARRSGNHQLPAAAASAQTGTLAEMERAAILARLESLGGNKRQTAESLGIDRGTLYNKLRAYGAHEPG